MLCFNYISIKLGENKPTNNCCPKKEETKAQTAHVTSLHGGGCVQILTPIPNLQAEGLCLVYCRPFHPMAGA